MYIRYKDSDYVHIDFNIPDNTPYQMFDEGEYITVYAEAGENNILNINRSYSGYSVITNNWGYKVLYADSIGMCYDRSFDNYLDIIRNVIAAIVYDSSGNKKYFTNSFRPNFHIIPVTKINTSQFTLDFQITHNYTWVLGTNDPPWHSGLDFIDSVVMYSYYSREDSVIYFPPTVPLHYTDPVNIDYGISLQVDTLLLKNGFEFNYRFVAKDKNIIPGYSNSPDSGYYKCTWDKISAINEYETESVTIFSLLQNYPNPFNPVTKIKYSIPNVGTSFLSASGGMKFVQVKVYDVLGNEIATLVNEEKPAGNYEVEFDGSGLPSGVYFYQLKAGSYVETKKMILLR